MSAWRGHPATIALVTVNGFTRFCEVSTEIIGITEITEITEKSFWALLGVLGVLGV